MLVDSERESVTHTHPSRSIVSLSLSLHSRSRENGYGCTVRTWEGRLFVLPAVNTYLTSIIPFIFSIHPHVTHAVHPFGRRVTRGRVRRTGIWSDRAYGPRAYACRSLTHPHIIRGPYGRSFHSLILYTLSLQELTRVAMLQRLKGEVSHGGFLTSCDPHHVHRFLFFI